MVRANLSQVVIGNTNRATESRHATGAEAEIPDISEYSRGRKGYFQVWDPQAKEITARGRTFLLGVPPDELAYCKRIVDARKGTRRALPAVELALRRPPGARSRSGSTGRQRDAGEAGGGQGRNEAAPAAASPARVAPARLPADIPPADAQALLALLGEPEGTSAGPAGAAIGKSKATANRYLNLLRDHGIAELVTAGRSSRYRLAGKPAPQPEPEQAGEVTRVPDHPGPRRGRPRGAGRRGRGDPGGTGEGPGDRAPPRPPAPHGGASAAGRDRGG